MGVVGAGPQLDDHLLQVRYGLSHCESLSDLSNPARFRKEVLMNSLGLLCLVLLHSQSPQ